jgi:very-short-patch-repair endonuclease
MRTWSECRDGIWSYLRQKAVGRSADRSTGNDRNGRIDVTGHSDPECPLSHEARILPSNSARRGLARLRARGSNRNSVAVEVLTEPFGWHADPDAHRKAALGFMIGPLGRSNGRSAAALGGARARGSRCDFEVTVFGQLPPPHSTIARIYTILGKALYYARGLMFPAGSDEKLLMDSAQVDVAPSSAVVDETLRGKLDRARTELLDLSGRNRLLNTPRRTRTARTVEVVDERSEEVFRLLVEQGRSFTFAPGRVTPASHGPAEDGVAMTATALLPQPEYDELDDPSVARRHANTRLQTLLTTEGLQKRLLDLYFDARTLEEEQGVNILYLALGFLKWFEAPSSDIARFAPLILVPVSLQRGTATERFRLRWTQEDAASNLSLVTLMRREHGLVFPGFGGDEEDEEVDPATYFAKVAATVTDKPRWEVLPNDIVLGFFSFAKFLMYRDLDPGNWPKEVAIDAHPLVANLLGEGFEPVEPSITDDDNIDVHFAPADLLHVVDADSSQTVAINEARHGNNLVIQGPPGTGKSQTIANIVAGAVADGKTVLFVAEKMAALEVVKRRLDNIGLGDMCLELHSNKARKREVLQELKRTWELGRPNGYGDGGLLRRLHAARDALNEHAGRLHQLADPARLSAYHCIGHLVRLQREGQTPTDISLGEPETWLPDDKVRYEQALLQLSRYVEDIGVPEQHPWRGVGLDAMLRTDLDRLIGRIREIRGQLSELLAIRDELHATLEIGCPDSFAELERFSAIGATVAAAPEELDREAIRDVCWEGRHQDIADLVDAGTKLTSISDAIAGVFIDAAWSTDLQIIRQPLALHGASWFRGLKGNWRRANALFRSLLTSSSPKSVTEQVRLLDQLIAGQKSAADLARDDDLGRSAFGMKWRGDKSDWLALRRIIEWNALQAGTSLGVQIRRLTGVIDDRRPVGELVRGIHERQQAVTSALHQLIADLRLELLSAFGTAVLEEISLAQLAARLALWAECAEDLSKWIAYRARADQAKAAGLGQMVERLGDGQLDRDTVIGAFEMAYYEAVLRSIVSKNPELAGFDGDAHARTVQDFRDFDLKRIELARLEVAAAHYQQMPNRDGAAGPLGVLKGEMARKIGHMPIRRLMRRAGTAIQAIKPVLMMSPLSVAQFLEPGGLSFDVLVIDEASQVQPIDALGAVARCGRMIVVGDDRQLPPTTFFNKLTGSDPDEDDADDGAAQIADIESILGLCSARGVPSRMLRWHYRSRHQSLIAVSNSQFYENKLFIVPSPFTSEVGIGLHFNLVRNGVFDRGNTATNSVEAKMVAEAVIRHAQERPDQSLGVATFSVAQRRLLLDELEHLRRLNPDTEEFFTKPSPEPFFVKNLENIQGDERDVILISVGYGKDKSGYMAMQFGPLSSEGGERRLNVLISRAKQCCEVFASITDEDIDLERGRGKGVAALKLFLNFARTGQMSIGQPTDREHDSIFEAQVAVALRAEGYDVRPQIGLAGFFIDLAIVDAKHPGRYLLGIECDGASYHSSRSARDRDRLRQAVLEDHGWIIHRIWSTDWFQRPQDQLRKTVHAIETAKIMVEARRADSGPVADRAVPVEIVTVDRGNTAEVSLEHSIPKLSVTYQEATFSVPSFRLQLHDVPADVMARIIHQIVSVEGPVHAEEIVVRVRSLWGLHRAGNRIQAAVARGLAAAARSASIAKAGDFYSLPGDRVEVRDRSAASSLSLRRPEMLPPIELQAAALRVVDTNYGAERGEVVTIVSRVLGFKATSAQLHATIDRAIDGLLAGGVLSASDDGTLIRAPA